MSLTGTTLFMALFAGLVAVFVACGAGGDGATREPTSAPQASSTPGAAGSGELVVGGSEPVAFAFAPDGRMFYTERTSGEVKTIQLAASTVTAAEQQLAPVLATKQDLARRVDTQPDNLRVVSVTAMQWPDACLGVGGVNEACVEVITPGYQVVLRAPGSSSEYTYRTDESTNIRVAGVNAVAAEGHVFATLDVYYRDECGLIGVAIDPDFQQNRYVYVYAVRPVAGRDDIGKPAVIRYTDVGGQGADPMVILDLPETNSQTCAQVSGNLHFGADGFLYVSVGNLEQPDLSAGLAVPVGKILRLNKEDGSAAAANPFTGQAGADARTFAYGFRNPFDFAFDPQSGKLYAPDNGPGNCDELNLIEAGQDYGAPGSLQVEDVPSCLGLGGVDPIYLFALEGKEPGTFGSNLAPAGVAFLRGDRYPRFGEGLLVCEFVPRELHLLQIDGAHGDQVSRDTIVNSDCQFNVEIGSDGLIYYSNRQGIFRIPAQAP